MGDLVTEMAVPCHIAGEEKSNAIEDHKSKKSRSHIKSSKKLGYDCRHQGVKLEMLEIKIALYTQRNTQKACETNGGQNIFLWNRNAAIYLTNKTFWPLVCFDYKYHL